MSATSAIAESARAVAGQVTVQATTEYETALIRPYQPVSGVIVPAEMQHVALEAIESGRHIAVTYSRGRKVASVIAGLVPALAGAGMIFATAISGSLGPYLLTAGVVVGSIGMAVLVGPSEPFVPRLYRRALNLRGTTVTGAGRESLRVWRQAVERAQADASAESALPAIHRLALAIADAEDDVDRLQTARAYLPADEAIEQAKRQVASLVEQAESRTSSYLANRWAAINTDQPATPALNPEHLR